MSWKIRLTSIKNLFIVLVVKEMTGPGQILEDKGKAEKGQSGKQCLMFTLDFTILQFFEVTNKFPQLEESH